MKHILNNISQEEKQRILEQHSGGKTIDTSKFRQLLESKLGNVKPLLYEQPKPAEENTKTITSKLLTDGIKNVTPEMITEGSFHGYYSKYVLEGKFKNVIYVWDGTGVPGMPDELSDGEYMAVGNVLTDNNSVLPEIGITDADPNGVWIGFNGSGLKFFCYNSTEGSLKCSNF
jgi:hypothetical protein